MESMVQGHAGIKPYKLNSRLVLEAHALGSEQKEVEVHVRGRGQDLGYERRCT